MKEWSILTPINEAVVVLLVGFGRVALPLEQDVGDSFRATACIVMKGDILERSDGGVEQFLLDAANEHDGQRNHQKTEQTLTWASFTSVGRLDTIIFSAV